MRIASLVPSSTEMLFELGVGEQVVAVTHECDWPAAAATLPKLTSSVIPAGLSAGEIDRTVRETVGHGEPLYRLDRDRLEELDPELIVTQAVCEVCAVSFDDVVAVAATLPSRPRVISLDPSTLDEVLADVTRLGEAAGVPEAAAALRAALGRRLGAVRAATAGQAHPRVLCLEWLDPPYVAGHWVPEMVTSAGGANIQSEAGGRSEVTSWDMLTGAEPGLILVMPCGYDAERSAEEARAYADRLAALGAARVVAVDASAYFSRPGPRLVTGVELLGHILHPDVVQKPDQAQLIELAGVERSSV